MDHHDLNASGRYVLKELLELGASGNLLSTGAAFIIFIEVGVRKAPVLALISYTPHLRLAAKIFKLHSARTTNIASDDRRCLRFLMPRLHIHLLQADWLLTATASDAVLLTLRASHWAR